MNFRLLYLVAIGFLWPVHARAECTSAGITNFSFCNNCRATGVIAVDRDHTCERPLNPRANDGSQIDSVRISRQAKRGRAGMNGYSLAFNPAKGFVGTDQFEIEVNWRRASEAGKVFITFDVTVR